MDRRRFLISSAMTTALAAAAPTALRFDIESLEGPLAGELWRRATEGLEAEHWLDISIAHGQSFAVFNSGLAGQGVRAVTPEGGVLVELVLESDGVAGVELRREPPDWEVVAYALSPALYDLHGNAPALAAFFVP